MDKKALKVNVVGLTEEQVTKKLVKSFQLHYMSVMTAINFLNMIDDLGTPEMKKIVEGPGGSKDSLKEAMLSAWIRDMMEACKMFHINISTMLLEIDKGLQGSLKFSPAMISQIREMEALVNLLELFGGEDKQEAPKGPIHREAPQMEAKGPSTGLPRQPWTPPVLVQGQLPFPFRLPMLDEPKEAGEVSQAPESDEDGGCGRPDCPVCGPGGIRDLLGIPRPDSRQDRPLIAGKEGEDAIAQVEDLMKKMSMVPGVVQVSVTQDVAGCEIRKVDNPGGPKLERAPEEGPGPYSGETGEQS